MGRGKRRSRTRDDNSITRHSRRFDTDLSVSHFPSHFRRNLLQIEDNRSWHPDRFTRPARTFTGQPHYLVVHPRSRPAQAGRSARLFNGVPSAIGFHKPEKMTVCERRQRRRRTLFAFKKTGRAGQRRPRWNDLSYVNCKRRR